jgi:hypothetical protein
MAHLYGPAAGCKRFSSIRRLCGLASMYPASTRSMSLLQAIKDISAPAFSLPDRPRKRPFASPGCAGPQKTGPPFVFILSQTSTGKRDVLALSKSVQLCGEAVVRLGNLGGLRSPPTGDAGPLPDNRSRPAQRPQIDLIGRLGGGEFSSPGALPIRRRGELAAAHAPRHQGGQRAANSCRYCWRGFVCHSPHPALLAGGAGAGPGHFIAGHECRLLLSPDPDGPLLEETASLTSPIQ